MENKDNDLHRALKGLSKLLLQFNIDFDDLCKTLREYYVLEAYKKSKTISRTSLKIGIDRRTISAIINNKNQYTKPSSIFTILNQIKIISNTNNTKFIKKQGENSVQNAIEDVANGATTLNSVIDELVELGCLVDRGESVELLTTHIGKAPSKKRTLQIFSNHVDRYVNTILNNLNCSEQSKKNYEYTVYSTRIDPRTISELHDNTRSILKKTTDELMHLFESFDQDVPVGTYKEIGVSLTQFNLNNKEE